MRSWRVKPGQARLRFHGAHHCTLTSCGEIYDVRLSEARGILGSRFARAMTATAVSTFFLDEEISEKWTNANTVLFQ